MNAFSPRESCSTCTYFEPGDEVCQHRDFPAGFVDPKEWCTFHSPIVHDPQLCTVCSFEGAPDPASCHFNQRGHNVN